MGNTITNLHHMNQRLQSRIDELEDRSRRDNIILHGIPDAQETWAQTEDKVVSLLSSCIDSQISSTDIERAHRLGQFSDTRCRPVIVKLSSFKSKEKIMQSRSRLREREIRVTEDFSLATRTARKKLIEFAKSQPQPPSFQLKYNKLLMDNKCYMYCHATNSVFECSTNRSRSVSQNTSLPPPPASSTEPRL